MTPTIARLRLVAAAALFSTGGAAIKATTLNAWQVASFRSGVAALALVLLVPAARRRWSLRVVAVGTLFAGTMILFVLANKLTTSANAIFLQSTAPLWVLLAGPLLHERATRDDVLLMLVIAAGMALVFVGADRAQATAPDPLRGNLLAIVSGVFYAGTVLGLRWLGRGHAESSSSDGVATVVAGNVVACLVALPMALGAPSLHVPALHAPDVAVVLYLGVVQIGLAYLALSTAMPHVPAIEASTLLLVEPALNPVWAYLVHHERPSPLAWAGGALIVLGAAAKTLWDARRERPAPGADARAADARAPATVPPSSG